VRFIIRRLADMILSRYSVRSPHLNQNLLSRGEVVALLNVLRRFSESLHATEDFRRMWNERKATEVRSAVAGTSFVHRTKPDRDTISLGSSASQPEGRSRAPGPQPLPPHSHTATSSQTARITNTKAKAVTQIQNLGRTVYEACKRSTIGCLHIISGFTQSVLRRFADWDGRDGQTSGGDL
jgi:hypothetical protein